MMNVNEMKIGDLLQLANALGATRADDSHWEVGAAYFIRTVTHHYTGRLLKVTSTELLIEDAAWIADDGRFADFLKSGEASEVEPYPDGVKVILGRSGILDAVKWTSKLPREQK
jgi:hypothetical protein